MRRHVIYVLIFTFIIFSSFACAMGRAPQKSEDDGHSLSFSHAAKLFEKSPDYRENILLKSLSEDIAKIYMLIEAARTEFDEEPLTVKVIEPWSKPDIKKFNVKGYAPKARSRIEVPTSKGSTKVDLHEFITANKTLITVTNLDKIHEVIRNIDTQKLRPIDTRKFGSYSVEFYDDRYANDAIYTSGVEQYISFSSKVEETSRKIIKDLVELQKKYDNSPVYIEGFTLGLPFTVDLHFKLK